MTDSERMTWTLTLSAHCLLIHFIDILLPVFFLEPVNNEK